MPCLAPNSPWPESNNTLLWLPSAVKRVNQRVLRDEGLSIQHFLIILSDFFKAIQACFPLTLKLQALFAQYT